MSKHEHTRVNVAEMYANVVTAPSQRACCPPVQKGILVKLAGYSREELADLPPDAVVNSFGCGNPLAFSGVREGDVVLDLGCGAGIDILLAAKRVGPTGRAIGVDMTDTMLAKARETIAAAKLTNLEVRKGLIENLPVDSSSVDWAISNCVISLSPEKEQVFAEIARVLRPGGQMMVSDVVAEDLPPQVHGDLRLYACCLASAISEDEYRTGLQRVGLIDVAIRERIQYSLPQLQGLIESDHKASTGHTGCCGIAGARSFGDLAALCNGKVWSAKIYARKPL